MATKKSVTGYVKGVGKRSLKRSGLISTSVRLSVADNKKFHNAAKAENRSFNSWAFLALQREANRVLALKAKSEATLG
jgi:hypothetical protein